MGKQVVVIVGFRAIARLRPVELVGRVVAAVIVAVEEWGPSLDQIAGIG